MSAPIGGNRRVARNSILNLVGQLIPIAIGIVSIPFVMKGLGIDSFGILSLAWMLLGYFTLFDLGLGRATTKFVAEELRLGETVRFRALFWTSSIVNFALGAAGSLIVVALSSYFANSVFRIPVELVLRAEQAFFILGLSLPIVLVSTALRGTLEAGLRFDYVNIVAVASSSLNFLLPLVAIYFGLNVRDIVLVLIISRAASAFAYFSLCLKAFPTLRNEVVFDFSIIKNLMSFGGWISISNVVNPFLVYFDRFMIGSTMSIAAVSYYAAPYEMVSRFMILPVSLSIALFPSFSAVGVATSADMKDLYVRSIKVLLLLMGPITILTALFAREILQLWLGSEFAIQSTEVVQILAIGVFINSPGTVPYTLLQGFGRPDLTAKFHLIELLLYVPMVWLLVKQMGIVGGALAWTIRITIDALLVFVASGRFVNLRYVFGQGLKRSINVVAVLWCVSCVPLILQWGVVVKLIVAVLILFFFALLSWRFVLDDTEREFATFSTRRFMRVVMRKETTIYKV